MNKINKKIIVLIILGLFVINIFSIKNFVYSAYFKYLYGKNNLTEIEKNIKNEKSLIGVYNKGVVYYKQKKYEKALEAFLSINYNHKDNFAFNLFYNIGNSYYKYGELQNNSKQKINLWLKAISYYEKALDIKYDKKTKENIEFILKKIKQEKKSSNKKEENKNNKQNDNNKSTKNNNNNSGNNKENNQNKTNNSSQKKDSGKEKGNGKSNEDNINSQEKSGKKIDKGNEKKSSSENKKGGEKSGKNNNVTNKKIGEKKDSKESKDGKKTDNLQKKNSQNGFGKSNNKNNFSKKDLELLKAYENKVKNDSKNLGDYYGKVYKKNDIDPFDTFDNFFGGSMFDDDLFGGSDKKDW